MLRANISKGIQAVICQVPLGGDCVPFVAHAPDISLNSITHSGGSQIIKVHEKSSINSVSERMEAESSFVFRLLTCGNICPRWICRGLSHSATQSRRTRESPSLPPTWTPPEPSRWPKSSAKYRRLLCFFKKSSLYTVCVYNLNKTMILCS